MSNTKSLDFSILNTLVCTRYALAYVIYVYNLITPNIILHPRVILTYCLSFLFI